MRAFAAALFAIGLTIGGVGGAPASAAPRDWRTTGLHPIGQPIEVGGVAVGYLVRDRHLYARAMRPESGEVLWEREITPSRQTAGILILPAKAGDNVVLLEPRPQSGKNWASLAIIEPVTGRVLQNSRPAIFRTTPYGCFDDEAACAMSVPFKGGVRKEYRLDSMTGAFTPNPADLASARTVGEGGLMELGIRPEEPLALVRDGEIQWRRPIGDAFPTGYSTDNGWNWMHAEEEGVFAGSVYGPGTWTADAVSIDLSKGASAGLDERTGAVLWRDNGSEVGCDYSLSLRGEPVRCRSRGTVRYEHKVQRESFKDVDVTLEGFDPRTGRTRWSIPAGPATALISFLTSTPVAGARSILADLPAGKRKIDLADGSLTVPAPGEVFWCLTRSRFDFHEGYTSDEFPERFDRVGDNLATACTADGKPARSGKPSAEATKAVGATANGYSVVATIDGYRGIAVGG
ncbi:hypothetical protein [Actinoplanes subglobosus]|uniref:Pyrroloquinoline-quinone binding quinoprotein n=1 Tax=Actinoplanes subglobosus TaxID=1547892 RepID=A0ABV8IPW6_9ACTN